MSDEEITEFDCMDCGGTVEVKTVRCESCVEKFASPDHIWLSREQAEALWRAVSGRRFDPSMLDVAIRKIERMHSEHAVREAKKEGAL